MESEYSVLSLLRLALAEALKTCTCPDGLRIPYLAATKTVLADRALLITMREVVKVGDEEKMIGEWTYGTLENDPILDEWVAACNSWSRLANGRIWDAGGPTQFLTKCCCLHYLVETYSVKTATAAHHVTSTSFLIRA